ncbi:MAG TPA: tetraacyldisaccharide 4'-kinase [Terriglobia bacterium]|nr:tetraacyldisaccharide 4'-kinase [Terriglobia bacterium]
MSAALGPLGRLYGISVTARAAAYRRGWLRQRRLPRPVVSVGNLTAGGTGKTPLVRLTVDRLIQRGRRPAVLIRGYRRQRGPDAIVIPPKPGRAPEPREVGDEAAWLARMFPDVPIGVSAHRFPTGELIAANYPLDVFVLDDGFQHLALARDLDVVAIDATRETSDGQLLPAGLQREPCAALARAGLIVITRTELADPAALEAKVRKVNSSVPIVRARTRLDHLTVTGGATVAADEFVGQPVHAFCGIGNPDAFFRNLRLWGFDVVRESVFPDHHVYRNLNFARSGSVAALVTTEKDLMNLAGLDLSGLGVPVVGCATRFELEDVAAFDEVLLGCLS